MENDLTDHYIKPGSTISDYVIKEQIAVGGFGTVWRAIHGESGRVAAIKVLHDDLVTAETLVLRFEREAQAIASMRHPSIVELYEHGRLDDGRPFLIMEYLAGRDLGTHIALHGTLSPEQVSPILDQLGEALTAAHGQGIVHRDLKASNVFLTDRDGSLRVVLFDFGIAKLIDSEGPNLTLSSSLLGSPSCMSPEQILGNAVDPRTDIYGLGALTYHMLVGHTPFSGAGATAILTMHLEDMPPAPSHYGDVSPVFDDVVFKAMSKDPKARYRSIAEFAQAFRDALADDASDNQQTQEYGRTAPAVGMFVDVRAEGSAADDPDDDLLDDMESIVPRVVEELDIRGYILAYERGNSALFVLPLPLDAATALEVRRQAVDAACSLFSALGDRPDRDDRVRVNLYLHVDIAMIEGQRVKSGPLLDSSTWTPPVDTCGVFCSPDVLNGIEITATALPSSELLRLSTD